MNRHNLDTKLVFSAIGVFFLAYIFTFPTGWLISDVYSYMNQGIAISNGEKILTYNDPLSNQSISYNGTSYPLGNAFWIAFWIKLCSLKYVYIGSLFSIVVSTFLIYKILEKNKYSKLALLLVFVYPSLGFFSNSLMSSVPSLLLVSSFLYGLFFFEESGKKWFCLSFIAALSFWVRETNLVLLGSICLIHFFQTRKYFFHYSVGSIIGFLPRVISSDYYYGDPFHFVLAESFSFSNFINNIGVYAILLLCFMPLGLLFIVKYKGRYTFPMIISSSLFILMYSFYSFNATAYSGFYKGIILMGRFMIPILPIYIISVGWYYKNKSFSSSLKILATIITYTLIIGMQIMVYKEAKVHKDISDHIYATYSDKMVMYDLSRTTNIVRYINPFHGNLYYISDISSLANDDYINNLFKKYESIYLIQTLNLEHEDKVRYTSKIDNLIKSAIQKYVVTEVENIKIKQSLHLQVIKINKKDGKYK